MFNLTAISFVNDASVFIYKNIHAEVSLEYLKVSGYVNLANSSYLL